MLLSLRPDVRAQVGFVVRFGAGSMAPKASRKVAARKTKRERAKKARDELRPLLNKHEVPVPNNWSRRSVTSLLEFIDGLDASWP